MSKIITVPVSLFIAQVEQIAAERPAYKLGHDGSDGLCDCIGLVRGALKRAGANPTNLRGTNQAARKSIVNLHQVKKAADLQLGQVVLKVRDADDPDYRLPDKYRKGGTEYNGDLTNYTHIGVVTKASPLRITHMTSPEPAVDTKIGKWCYAGDLRYIDGEDTGGTAMQATTHADNGKPINFRKQPGGALLDKIPVGTEVELISGGNEWSQVVYKGRTGYVMTGFLVTSDAADADCVQADEDAGNGVTVTIPRTVADAIVQLADMITAANGLG